MRYIFVDVETYYDDHYSLRRMTPAEYILDPRFECIGWAVCEGRDGKPEWMDPFEFQEFLHSLPSKVMMVSHNALFDMPVLAWRFGYVPTLMVDTLGMSRAWLGHKLKSHALAKVALHLGLGAKGDALLKTIGMSGAAIRQSVFWDEYQTYAMNDVDLCRGIFYTLLDQGYPRIELAVMDMVLRCCVEPQLQLDQTALAEHLHATKAAKDLLINRALLSGVIDQKGALMSNDKFAEALIELGVEPPTKTSLTTGKTTYAFAKTDPDFLALEEHHDPRVQVLVSARLGTKSTLEETRTERLLSISHLTWPGKRQRMMPIPLRYSGAHTHRLSGDWKINMQNLPSRKNNKIRTALVAPAGHMIVAADASQIEARMAGWFAGCTLLTSKFANKEDVYSSFASSVFGYPVNKKEHPTERFVGKTAVLGLQYGLSWPKFQKTVALQSKDQLGNEIALSDVEAARVIDIYRRDFFQIPQMWQRLRDLIGHMARSHTPIVVGPVSFEHQRILLPSGLYLNYADLRFEEGNFFFTFAGKPKRIYGGALLENIIQALARIQVMDAGIRVRRRLSNMGLNFPLAMQVHDELVYVVPEAHAQAVLDMAIEELSRPPSWGVDLPLAAEGGIGPNYGSVK